MPPSKGLSNLLGWVLKEAAPNLKLVTNNVGRFFSGQASAEKYLSKLAKEKILSQKSSWRPTQALRLANLEGKQQAIRDARAAMKAASNAELQWMLNNADKASKVLKSGSKEFGGATNKLSLQKAREEALKQFITKGVKTQAFLSGQYIVSKNSR